MRALDRKLRQLGTPVPTFTLAREATFGADGTLVWAGLLAQIQQVMAWRPGGEANRSRCLTPARIDGVVSSRSIGGRP